MQCVPPPPPLPLPTSLTPPLPLYLRASLQLGSSFHCITLGLADRASCRDAAASLHSLCRTCGPQLAANEEVVALLMRYYISPPSVRV